MRPIQQRRGTSPEKERNRVQDHKDGPWKESPELLELACCSYRLKTGSCLQPEDEKRTMFCPENHMRCGKVHQCKIQLIWDLMIRLLTSQYCTEVCLKG